VNTLDDKAIANIQRVPWLPSDDPDMRDARIVGRAIVDTVGGGRFHALVVAASRFDTASREMRVRLFAVVWERSTSRFVALPMWREGIEP